MFTVQWKYVTSVMRLMWVTLAQGEAKTKFSQYNFGLEFTARMSLNGYSVIEVPIAYSARLGGSKVYSLRQMPRVVSAEFRALRTVKRENNDKRLKPADS